MLHFNSYLNDLLDNPHALLHQPMYHKCKANVFHMFKGHMTQRTIDPLPYIRASTTVLRDSPYPSTRQLKTINILNRPGTRH